MPVSVRGESRLTNTALVFFDATMGTIQPLRLHEKVRDRLIERINLKQEIVDNCKRELGSSDRSVIVDIDAITERKNDTGEWVDHGEHIRIINNLRTELDRIGVIADEWLAKLDADTAAAFPNPLI